ncbi:DUF2231 domain-containing protein [Plantactinospora sp. GCM10030261]|uniref:DUF2231 domain-containing protein n=1 Tax=Plantactinospora sp. GCM10030261 TaxID=3273420 RepID=UPI003608563E
MESRLRVQGHSIQPMLATFPFGLFACATVFDISVVAGAPALLGRVGYWTALAGLLATALTVLAGMVELWDTGDGVARRAALAGTLTGVGAAGLFTVVCLIRAGAGEPLSPTGGLVVVEVVALVVAAVGIVRTGRSVRRVDRGPRERAGFEAFRSGPAGFVAGDSPTRH